MTNDTPQESMIRDQDFINANEIEIKAIPK